MIVADGGSTKTNWCLIKESDTEVFFNTEGYNPFFVNTEYVVGSLQKSLPDDLQTEEVREVHFYGAGVHGESKANTLHTAFRTVFPNATVSVGHDLLAAARALLGNQPGFVAILGTGANTCLYDGEQLTHHIDSAAFILGDEGSGAYIGKQILTDYIRGYMPEAVQQKFRETYQLTPSQILDEIYTKPLPNRFCASFSRFAFDNDVAGDYTVRIIKNSFHQFFSNLVSRYPDYRNYSFNCIGSVGYTFKDILAETAGTFGMTVGSIIRSPINNLVKFHRAK